MQAAPLNRVSWVSYFTNLNIPLAYTARFSFQKLDWMHSISNLEEIKKIYAVHKIVHVAKNVKARKKGKTTTHKHFHTNFQPTANMSM
jgi:hypothetical protein